jgi:hypothetical protein
MNWNGQNLPGDRDILSRPKRTLITMLAPMTVIVIAATVRRSQAPRNAARAKLATVQPAKTGAYRLNAESCNDRGPE